MTQDLTAGELRRLVASAFSPGPADRELGVLIDLPDAARPDRPAWCERRRTALGWVRALRGELGALGLAAVRAVLYRNVRNNNADLPPEAYLVDDPPPGAEELDADACAARFAPSPFDAVLRRLQIVLAPTELSATAPLKLAAPALGLRGATLPGFSAEMIPALKLDPGPVGAKIDAIKALLDEADGADLSFLVDGAAPHAMRFDLRHRAAHASSGLFPRPGMVGNLPGGECYIVPYEGEKGEASRTAGTLPVQLGEEVVVYRVERNKAVAALGDGGTARQEAAAIAREPAYANLAELGFGVLRGFGVRPIGELLLDEKLGLHIAFGRSDHFGGAVGVKDFSSPDAVVHIDRLYIPELQARVAVPEVTLVMKGGARRPLMRDGEYVGL